MKKILLEKRKLPQKLYGSYIYHGITLSLFKDDAGKASLWVVFSDHAYKLFEFTGIKGKRKLIKHVNRLSSEIKETLDDNYGEAPLSDYEFNEYMQNMMPYLEADDIIG